MYETVETVDDYYDGPRSGRAIAFGRPCRYETLGWSDRGDPDEERFVLTFTDGSDPHSVVATAVFRVAAGQPELAPGIIRQLEVEWILPA